MAFAHSLKKFVGAAPAVMGGMATLFGLYLAIGSQPLRPGSMPAADMADPNSSPDLLDPAPPDDLAAPPDLVTRDLATPDLAMPDLAMPDFAMPDLAKPDLAMPDLAMADLATPDLAMPDLTPSTPLDLLAIVDSTVPPDLLTDLVMPDGAVPLDAAVAPPDLTSPGVVGGAAPSGCGCVVGGGEPSSPELALGLLLLVAFVLQRRRR